MPDNRPTIPRCQIAISKTEIPPPIILEVTSIDASLFVFKVAAKMPFPNNDSWFKRTGMKDKYIYGYAGSSNKFSNQKPEVTIQRKSTKKPYANINQ